MGARLSLLVDFDFGGPSGDEISKKCGDLVVGRDGVAASGFAGIIIRRLVAAGYVGGWPESWHVKSVSVSVVDSALVAP